MYKQADIMFMYAETSVHVGGGESVGAIDLAIAREKYTDFPFIPSSGVKGAIRDWFENHTLDNNNTYSKEEVKVIFGGEDGSDGAGSAIFTDARLLLFPVKSLKGVFAWITCPFALDRFSRDLAMGLQGIADFKAPNVDDGKAKVNNGNKTLIVEDNKIILEEYILEAEDNDPSLPKIISSIVNYFPSGDEYAEWRKRIKNHLIILSDNDFTDFVKSSTEVQTRIKLGEGKSSDTSKGGNLFYQENLPADSLLYSVVAANKPYIKNGAILNADSDVLAALKKLDTQRVQFGGNESVGKGIFCIAFDKKNQSLEANL